MISGRFKCSHLLILFISLTLIGGSSFAQCGANNFEISNPTCENAPVQIIDVPSYGEYRWDFCPNDTLTFPNAVSVETLPSAGNSSGMTLVSTANKIYGFLLAGTALFRYEFSTSDFSVIDVENLGNVGGLLSRPTGIEFVFEGGQWYAIAVNFNNSELLRLDFGASLVNNSPSITSLGDIGTISRPQSLELRKSGGNWIAIVPSSDQNKISAVNFGNSILNIPMISDVLEYNISASELQGISLIQDCDTWFGLVVSRPDQKVFMLNYGTDLFSTPSIVDISGNLTLPVQLPTEPILIREFGNFYALITSTNRSMHLLDFGNTLSNVSPVSERKTDLPTNFVQMFGIDVIKSNSQYVGFTFSLSNRELFRLDFDEPSCLASERTSSDQFPIISYLEGGKYFIEFEGQLVDGETSYSIDSVTVLNQPTVAFESTKNCQGEATEFQDLSTTENGSVTSRTWDFDGLGSSNQQNPTFSFPAPGEYNISLSIVDASTCENSIMIPVKIFDSNDLQSDFSFESIICSNGITTFTDLSTASEDLPETWLWDFDGLGLSNDQNPSFIFENPGDFEVALTVTGQSGCEKTISKMVSVLEGPSPSFSVENACVGTLMEFDNTSTGQIETYEWDFDNGFTSNLENPSFEYPEPGSYDVSLTVENSAGCVTTYNRLVVVFASPQVQFSNDLSCEGNITQFNDLSSVDSSNLVSWRWDFGNPEASSTTSTDQDATHTFSRDGSFDVKLVSTSFFGCKDSLTQVVNVLPSPQADFTFDKACIGEPIQFQDTSVPVEGESIITYEWDIAGAFSNEPNPTTILGGAGDYVITLFTTSENLCLGSSTKTITVGQSPTLAIGTEVNCENEPVRFFDLTETIGDAIASWEWNFNNQGSAVDSIALFDFQVAGTYSVGLDIITENGCEFSFQDEVIVNQAPQAIFEMSATFGAPPLEIDFENRSVNAVSYLWNFDGTTESNTFEPQFIFNELGEYNPQLIAFSEDGCVDTLSRQVFVLIPELEIELTSLIIPEDSGDPVIIGIRNNGTLNVNGLKVLIDLGGEIELQEDVEVQMAPGESINYPLSLNIQNRNIDYICVDLRSELDEIDDINISNNSMCRTFTQQSLIVSNPYPNPANNTIILETVSTESRVLQVRILDLSGAIIEGYEIQLGLGQDIWELNVNQLRQGMYLLQIPDLNRTQKIHIAR